VTLGPTLLRHWFLGRMQKCLFTFRWVLQRQSCQQPEHPGGCVEHEPLGWLQRTNWLQ